MIDQLISFKKIAEKKNLTLAAKELFVSQSALTQSMKKLEKQLKCKLYFKSKNGIKLTEEGEIVLKNAIEINTLILNIKSQIREKNNEMQKIKFGMIDSVGQNLFTDILFKNAHIYINSTSNLLEQLKNSEIKFAIITEGAKLKNIFSFEKFGVEKLGIYTSKAIAKKIKKISDLKRFPFISYTQGSNTCKLILKQFKQDGKIKISPKLYSSSPEVIYQTICNGFGVAVLPARYVNEHKAKNIVEIFSKKIFIKRNLLLVYLKKTFLTKEEKNIIERLRISIY